MNRSPLRTGMTTVTSGESRKADCPCSLPSTRGWYFGASPAGSRCRPSRPSARRRARVKRGLLVLWGWLRTEHLQEVLFPEGFRLTAYAFSARLSQSCSAHRRQNGGGPHEFSAVAIRRTEVPLR